MEKASTKPLQSSFEAIEDPRVERTKQQKLMAIIIIAICGVLCGAEGWVEIEEFGNVKRDWLGTILDLPNGIPSHDTFGRVFARRDPKQFENCFLQWVGSLTEKISGVIATRWQDLEALTRRREREKSLAYGRVAWAAENRLVLAQVAVDEKSHQITAMPAFLQQLALEGCLVTIDAMGTQTAIAAHIIEPNGDYALALKEHQGTLYEEVQDTFPLAQRGQFAHILHQFHEPIEKGHGRLEIRKRWMIDDQECLNSPS